MGSEYLIFEMLLLADIVFFKQTLILSKQFTESLNV